MISKVHAHVLLVCSSHFSAVIENILLVEEYGNLEKFIIVLPRYEVFAFANRFMLHNDAAQVHVISIFACKRYRSFSYGIEFLVF